MPTLRKNLRLWLRKKVIPWAGPICAAAAIRILSATIRYELSDEAGLLDQEDPRPCIFAFWHNRILLMPPIYQKYWGKRPLVVMISRSRDGAMISDTAGRFGIESARGSSSGKGVAALIKLTKDLMHSGKNVGVTPDGPRGPRYSVQDGILHLARTSKLPVIPVTYELDKKWEANSWDGFQIPKPFTRCRVRIGRGIDSNTAELASEIRMALGE
ncbi:MAG: lysophospholipid acyltransferase family protein [Verrucomicrobiota bacterium]